MPPDRAEIQARRLKADEVRKPKRRASDDPVRLSDEARRWQRSLTNAEFRGVTQTLDLADPFRRSREGVKPEPLPPPVSAVIRAAYSRIQAGTPHTGPVIFRAVVAQDAGRHTMDELVAATKVELERRKAAKAKRRALHEADSYAAAVAYYASLNQPTKAATTETTRTAPASSQGVASSSETPGVGSVGVATAVPATVPAPTLTPRRGQARR